MKQISPLNKILGDVPGVGGLSVEVASSFLVSEKNLVFCLSENIAKDESFDFLFFPFKSR